MNEPMIGRIVHFMLMRDDGKHCAAIVTEMLPGAVAHLVVFASDGMTSVKLNVNFDNKFRSNTWHWIEEEGEIDA